MEWKSYLLKDELILQRIVIMEVYLIISLQDIKRKYRNGLIIHILIHVES